MADDVAAEPSRYCVIGMGVVTRGHQTVVCKPAQ